MSVMINSGKEIYRMNFKDEWDGDPTFDEVLRENLCEEMTIQNMKDTEPVNKTVSSTGKNGKCSGPRREKNSVW